MSLKLISQSIFYFFSTKIHELFIRKIIIKRTERFGNNGTGGNCPNYSIVEIGQNTEKSPGDLRRLTVSQTPVKSYQLKLISKTLKE